MTLLLFLLAAMSVNESLSINVSATVEQSVTMTIETYDLGNDVAYIISYQDPDNQIPIKAGFIAPKTEKGLRIIGNGSEILVKRESPEGKGGLTRLARMDQL